MASRYANCRSLPSLMVALHLNCSPSYLGSTCETNEGLCWFLSQNGPDKSASSFWLFARVPFSVLDRYVLWRNSTQTFLARSLDHSLRLPHLIPSSPAEHAALNPLQTGRSEAGLVVTVNRDVHLLFNISCTDSKSSLSVRMIFGES